MFVSASFMRLIGATVEQGRMFTDVETEVATKAPVAILSHEAWETRFGSDPAILGKTIILNGQPNTVVGVSRPRIQTPFGTPDAYIPIGYYPNAAGLQRGNRGVGALGTIKSGVTFANALADLRTLAAQQEAAYPTTNKGFGVELTPLKDQIVGSTRTPIFIVFAASGSCCSSPAPTSPTSARARRCSPPRAVGARRSWRGTWTDRAAIADRERHSVDDGWHCGSVPRRGRHEMAGTVLVANLPIDPGIRVDGLALAFAFVVSVFSGILFGMVPAWKASRTDVQGMLRSRTGAGEHGHARTRNTLVVVQLALSLALLVVRRSAHAVADRAAARQDWLRYEQSDDDAVPAAGREVRHAGQDLGDVRADRRRDSRRCPASSRPRSFARSRSREMARCNPSRSRVNHR
jgi:hypothetical protein